MHIITFTILTFLKSVVLRTFTLSCNRSPELFHCAELKIGIHRTTPFYFSLLSVTANTVFSVSVNLTTLDDTSHKWAHRVFVFCDWLISLSTISSRFIWVVACDRILFLFKANFHCVPHYVCLSIWWWSLELLPTPWLLWVANTATHMASKSLRLSALWVCTQKWGCGSYGRSVVNFLLLSEIWLARGRRVSWASSCKNFWLNLNGPDKSSGSDRKICSKPHGKPPAEQWMVSWF